MRVQRGRCISKQCGDTCPVEYKIEQCLPTSHLTHAMRNEHLAAVEPQHLTPLKPKGVDPMVKRIMSNIASNNPLLKPTGMVIHARQQIAALQETSGTNINVTQDTLKNLAAKERKSVRISLNELLDPLQRHMVDENNISSVPDNIPFIFRVPKDAEGEYENGVGDDHDPFRIYISAPKKVLSMLFNEMNRVNGGGILLHLDSTYKTNLLGYLLIPCGFSDRSSTFVPLFYVIASHQKEEVFRMLKLGFQLCIDYFAYLVFRSYRC